MRESLHFWPYVGRALRHASVTPALAGALTFSLGLMAVGVAAYAGAVPVLAAESPLVRQLAGADGSLDPYGPLMETLGATESGTGSAGAAGSGAGSGSGAADLLLGVAGPGAESPLDGTVPTDGSPLLSPSDFGYTPLAPAPWEDGGSDVGTPSGDSTGSDRGSGNSDIDDSPNSGGNGSGASSTGGGNGSGNSGNPDNSGGSGNSGNSGDSGDVSAPEPAPPPAPDPVLPPEQGGPVPEETELRIRDALRSEYDVLETWAAKVYAGEAEYHRLCLTASKPQRREAAKAAYNLFHDVQVADVARAYEIGYACGNSDGLMWSTSRYSKNYARMTDAYQDLISAAAELYHAWDANRWLDDPAANTDAWANCVTMNQATGQMVHLEAYEIHRVGVRP